MRSFAEGKAQFFGRWFKLVELVKCDSRLKVYICLMNYSNPSVKRLERLSGIERCWSGVFATAEQLPFINAINGGNSGIFEIVKTVDDIDILNAAFFSNYGSMQFIVVTDEEDFSMNIQEAMVAYFQGYKDVEALVSRVLVGHRSLLLSVDEVELNDDVEGWFDMKNDAFQKSDGASRIKHLKQFMCSGLVRGDSREVKCCFVPSVLVLARC